MNIFAKNRFMVVALVLLVILNITTLTFMWIRMQHPPGPPQPNQHENPDRVIRFLRQELQLDNQQIEAFMQQRRQHRVAARRINNEIHELKQEMLNELFQNQPDTVKVNGLVEAIAIKQKDVERLTFEHLRNLIKICGAQQEERLQKLLQEFFRRQPPPPLSHPSRPVR
jgi:Spy/CpxP family protein refolding chaperone